MGNKGWKVEVIIGNEGKVSRGSDGSDGSEEREK